MKQVATLLLTAFWWVNCILAPVEKDQPCKISTRGLPCGCPTYEVSRLASNYENGSPANQQDDNEFIYIDDMAFRKSRLPRDEEQLSGEILSLEFWPGGIIFYVIDESFSSQYTDLIRNAMKTIEGSVPGHLEFREAKTRSGTVCRTSYLRVEQTPSLRCVSEIGMQLNTPTHVWLNQRVCTSGTIIHELLHALGRYHEQCRPDRDYYISLVPSAMISTECMNFAKIAYLLMEKDPTLNEAYDIGSIMHYGSCTFSCRGEFTMVKRDGSKIESNRVKLTRLDIRKLKIMFPKSSKAHYMDEMCKIGGRVHYSVCSSTILLTVLLSLAVRFLR